jgi:predicted cobalt transporter CbtA
MLTAYVKRGVKAGMVGGLIFGLLVALVANPLVVYADELGHGDGNVAGQDHEHPAGEHPEEAVVEHHESAVSMMLTNAVSVVSGVLWGILLGGVVFGIAYYFLEPAIPGTGRTRSYLLGVAGFVTVSGSPWLVLPPQPPGVEQALPAQERITLYGAMMVVGALVCMLSGFMYDIDNMPMVVQWITHLVPARYFVFLLKGIYLKGATLPVLWFELLLLGMFSVIVLGVSILVFRKRLK